jgi:chitodextrinase
MRPARTVRAATVAAFLFALTPALAASPVSALLPPDTKPPTRPHHLRITAVGSYSVSLAWEASSDNSGSLSYVIQASNGYTMTVPQSSTTATFVGNLFPYNEYSFSVHAVDPSGNPSGNSNTVRATLPADTTVPSTPSVTITDIGSHHASFSWSSTDNDPYLSYFLYINGTQVGQSTIATSGTFYLPQANTSYTFTVRARDHGINFSALSAPAIFSTEPVDTSDTEPPTAPAAFDVFHYPADRELVLTWTQSTDNVDPPQAIRYEIYVNGVLAENVVGTGSTISYGEFGFNLISIIAVDSAGNGSAPVTVTTDI